MLWCNSCSLNTLPCCCGGAPVRFTIRNVAVEKLLLAVLFAMLLWWTCCSFLILNVAVVKLLLVLKLAMLLWWTSYSFWDLQCCCDEAAARFLNCFVAVVKLLLVLRFAMLMWWSSSSLCHSECCCGQTPAHFCYHKLELPKQGGSHTRSFGTKSVALQFVSSIEKDLITS